MHGLAIAFRDAAHKIDGPTTSTAPTEARLELAEDWRASIPQRLAELAEAWQAPEAWDGMSKAGGITMPGAITGLVANNEVVLHAWDLAVATGQPFDVAPENLQASWQMVYDTPDAPAEERNGLFGPRIPVADDAPLLDRTLAYAGRDPALVGIRFGATAVSNVYVRTALCIRSFVGSVTGSNVYVRTAGRQASSGPDLGVEEVFAGVEVGGVGAG